jgi:hypothetical protein
VLVRMVQLCQPRTKRWIGCFRDFVKALDGPFPIAPETTSEERVGKLRQIKAVVSSCQDHYWKEWTRRFSPDLGAA